MSQEGRRWENVQEMKHWNAKTNQNRSHHNRIIDQEMNETNEKQIEENREKSGKICKNDSTNDG